MNILILIFFMLVGCKTSSESLLKTRSEDNSVTTKSGKTTTETDAKTAVKTKTKRDPSKITKAKDTFETDPKTGLRVLKSHETTVIDVGKKTTSVDSSKDEQMKKFAELTKRAEEQRKAELEARLKKKMSPALSCALSGGLWFVAILVAVWWALRTFGSNLPPPFNWFAPKKKE